MTSPLTRSVPPAPARPARPRATLSVALRLAVLVVALLISAWMAYPLTGWPLPWAPDNSPMPLAASDPALNGLVAPSALEQPAPDATLAQRAEDDAPLSEDVSDTPQEYERDAAPDQPEPSATPTAPAAPAPADHEEEEPLPDTLPLAAYGYGIEPARVAAPALDPLIERRQRLAALSQTPAFQTMVSAVGRRVGQHWNAPADYREHGAEVRVQVGPGGRLTGVEILHSSDNNAYNKSVLSAALAASPFTEVNALPEDAQAVLTEFTLTFGSPAPAAPTTARAEASTHAPAESRL